MTQTYAHCPRCEELTNVVIEHESKIDDHFFDLRCNCGLRFFAQPHQLLYVNPNSTRQEEKEIQT